MADIALSNYRDKRDFEGTPEPSGQSPGPGPEGNRFVVQQHAATRMHYDFRIEADGVLISWAVPKGPSYDPAVKRLAVHVEDHPLDYRQFEGIIPGGNYGAGSVIVWDEGTYRNITVRGGAAVPVREAVEAGHVSVWLEGSKLIGGWSLTRFGPEDKSWTMVKRNDDRSDPGKDITAEQPRSVQSGRTIDDVMKEAAAAAGDPGRRALRGRGMPVASRGETSGYATAKFFPPMLAQAAPAPSSGTDAALPGGRAQWLFEPKLDGLRCLAVRNGSDVELLSRNGLSFNSRFAALVKALKAFPAENFVLDGEVVGIVSGLPDFGALQQGTAADVEFRVFDLPWLLGQDLRHLPIEDRKVLLSKTVEDNPLVKVVQALDGDAQGLFERACADGWEGLVAKRRGSSYVEGRSADWRKLKCQCRQEMVIGGYTEPSGARSGFGALLLGYWEGGELVYAGKVGTGFTERVLAELHRALVALERASSPFGNRVAERKPHWVEPDLVAEVAFTSWTPDLRLRHPSFLGLRPDRASREVVREECGRGASAPRRGRQGLGGAGP
ncbi:MAG: non-homologous end-joining DNA ligase [Acidimicrobiales bacterium]